MRNVGSGVLAMVALLSSAAALVVPPFSGADFSLDRRNNDVCPRVVGKYGYCDAVEKCCIPGYGCNTCGEGNVGYSCVKREKDGCKSDHDCYWSQKCIDNGKEPSFCAQLWVDDLPKPGDKKKKHKKKPMHGLNPSSLNPSSLNPSSLAPSSLNPSSLAPSSMIMAPSSMIMAPSSMIMAPTRAPKMASPHPGPTPAPKPTHR